MKTAIYPGSFDPMTNGHLDIIKRSAKIFDRVIVAVLVNPDKKGLFSIDERVELIKKATKGINNVKVESFSGLLIDFMKRRDANIIIKGIRTVADFEYEFQMSIMNKKLDPTVETVVMMTNPKYSFVSSSSVKQVAIFGGCIKGLVPECIVEDINLRVKEQKDKK